MCLPTGPELFQRYKNEDDKEGRHANNWTIMAQQHKRNLKHGGNYVLSKALKDEF